MKRLSIPLAPIGGMYSAGDAGSIPDGTTRVLENHLIRPNRLPKRPPFTYDNVMNVSGLANYVDDTNKVSRLVSLDTAANLRVKSATVNTETWGSPIAGIGVNTLTDFCNYKSKLYWMVFDSVNPKGAFSFDGTNVSSTPFTSAVQGLTCTAFDDRIFIAHPRVTVTPLNTIAQCYGSGWIGAVNTLRTVISGTTTVTRYFYPATASADVAIATIAVAASTTDLLFTARQDFRNNDPINALPVRSVVTYLPASPLDDLVNNAGARNLAVTAGQLGSGLGSGDVYLWRCITAGTTAGAAPAFGGVVLGGTIVDGTATWLAERSSLLHINDNSIPNAADSIAISGDGFITKYFPIVMPWRTNTVSMQIDFGFSTANILAPLAANAVDLSLKDGLADGDPRKANRGFQITTGDFNYPFVNTETATTNTVDLNSIIWTEIGLPNTIRASNTYKLPETSGYPTAAVGPVTSRYAVFKRNSFWVFQGTSDPDIPIQRESLNRDVGCLGPQAIDVFEDTIFFIGENEVYRMKIGSEPIPLCGVGMREEIMNKGANWVELQSTYKRPLLKVDKKFRELWVYTQKGLLYCYHLGDEAIPPAFRAYSPQVGMWTRHKVSTGIEVDAFLWNSNTQNLYVSFGGSGITRLNYAAATSQDTIDNTATNLSVSSTVTMKPIEVYQPPRFDAILEEIRFLHAATESQTGDTLTASYSFNQGSTYTKSDAVTISPLSVAGEFIPLRLPAWESGPTVTVKLVHAGNAGEAAWSLSQRAYAMINVLVGEYIQSNQTEGAATL